MRNPSLAIPSNVDFGFCPVGEIATFEITIKNQTKEESDFVWLFKEPFSISPPHGKIGGKKQISLVISFLPNTASRFDGTLVCRFGKNLLESSIIQVVGVAKVPHISLSTEFIDFGRVPSGTKATQSLTVHNSAPVPATVSIIPDVPLFIIQPTQVSLKPNGTETVKVSFQPTNYDFYAFSNILFSTAGGNSANMRCSAYVTGPKVSLDHKFLSLGNVQLKSTSSNIFSIFNHSDRKVFFEFMIEPTSVFSFDPSQGILPPNYSKSIRVTFKPEHPISYYRRVILLVHQHSPMALDLFGSAFDTFNHPPKLKASNIDNYRQITSEGLASKPPHLLPKVVDPSLPTTDYISNDLRRNQCDLNSGAQLFDELFAHHDLVTLSASHIEFGGCQRDVSPEKQSLIVKNNSDGPLTIYWQSNSDGFVSIEPSTSEIPKKQTTEFHVKFNPKLEFQFMGSLIEGFVQFKEMRNRNIIDFPTLPFLLLPFCDGHTMDDVTSFIPTMFTSHKSLNFAGAIAGDVNYQTFFVENRGDCAFKYDIRIDEAQTPDKGSVKPSSAAFSVYPQVGTILKGSFQIFVVRFSPSQRGHFHAKLYAIINDSPANSFSVVLRGDASVPAVSFSVTGTLFLHPVSLGSISSQTIKITNDSSVPMKLEWKIPSIYANHLIVKPQSAEIRSREIIDCLWEFHPDSVGEFRVEVICNVQALSNSSHSYIAKEMLSYIVGPNSITSDQSLLSSLRTVQHYPLTVCTLVSDCVVNSKPQSIDFGFVRINSDAVSTLSISNHSDSQMHFLLQSASPQKLLQFSPADDVLPPRSSREIEVHFTPRSPGEVTDSILCSLLNESVYQQEGGGKKSFEKSVVKSSASEICSIRGIGCFPHLSIVDVFSPKYSRALVWENGSCNAINEELNLLGWNSLTDDLKTFYVDFGFDTIDSEPTQIYLRFQNVGHIAFSFSINFPNDVSIDPEYWALPDEIDPNQLKQDQIMQAKLFKVSEKKFHLGPNSSCDVCFTYSHKFIESHQLPIVLSVQNGRIIRLILKGTTLDPSIPYLVNYKPVFELQSVPIGCIDPPIQLMHIFNASHTEADFRIDLTQVQETNEVNHNFDIFRCLTPIGNIKPRSHGTIQWAFKPLEAIDYEVSILCIVSNGNSFTVTLKGRGAHPSNEDCEVIWQKSPPKTLMINHVTPVIVSEQYLMFGDIPVFSKTDRIVFIKNNGQKMLNFEAEITSDIIKVNPKKWVLSPGQSQKLIVGVQAPSNPLIFETSIPLFYEEPHELTEEEVMEANAEAEKEQIIAADPPIGTSALRSSKIGGIKKLKERPEEWKSVGERTLEQSQKTKHMSSRLFSTHIGKRAEAKGSESASKPNVHFIDVAFNAMTKNQYRELYGSLDTFYFAAQNPTITESSGQHKDEVADLLSQIVNDAIADEQVQKLALYGAKERKLHIPLFSQIQSETKLEDFEKSTMTDVRFVDNIESILHEIVDEIIDEASKGDFVLDKDIIQVSGFKINQ